MTDLNILKETVTVRLTKGDTTELKTFPVEEIKWQKPQQNPENKPKNQENRGKRGKANRPAISSNLGQPPPLLRRIQKFRRSCLWKKKWNPWSRTTTGARPLKKHFGLRKKKTDPQTNPPEEEAMGLAFLRGLFCIQSGG